MSSLNKYKCIVRNKRLTSTFQAMVVACLLTPGVVGAQTLPAFPGAEGVGATSVGGRGGVVMNVTNLNNSGAGSLRACLEASGPRTCIFRVAGVINLTTGIRIVSPFVTIAGQTAPGGGIEIYGKNNCDDAQIFFYTHDIIMRYIRIRVGRNDACRAPGSQKGSILYFQNDSHNTIIDHVSASWTTDDSMAFYPNTGTNHDITLQYMFVGEGISGHAVCWIGGDNEGGASNQHDIDVHHVYFTGCTHRIPRADIASLRWVNNLTYNWSFYASQGLGGIQADFVNNFYKAGPLDPGFHELQFSESTPDGPTGNPSIYLSGNIGPHNSNPAADNWVMANRVTGENGTETGPAPASFKRFSPLSAETFPIVPTVTASLPGLVLGALGSGASARLDCTGNLVGNRDAVDTRLANDYANNTGGIINDEADVGGMPTPAAGTACPESLGDGIPDAWKIANGLSTSDVALSSRIAGNGYTYLENYLNGSNEAAAAPPLPPTGLTAIVK